MDNCDARNLPNLKITLRRNTNRAALIAGLLDQCSTITGKIRAVQDKEYVLTKTSTFCSVIEGEKTCNVDQERLTQPLFQLAHYRHN